MRGIFDLENLGADQRADLLDAMAEDQPQELAALLGQAAKAQRRIGGIQMPLIPYDPLPLGFDREEKLADGRLRWLTPLQAEPVMDCDYKTVYRRFAKNPRIGVRVGGSIFIDRLAIARFKVTNSRKS